MQLLYTGMILFLLLNLGLGMIRIHRGPSEADRMLAAQLLATTAIGILLLLSQTEAGLYAIDVAILFALLAAITTLAFVRKGWSQVEAKHGSE